jgi:ribokinase
MSNIVVIGSSNTDMVVKTPRFPAAGETILGGVFFMFAGGKGANQAVACSRMGGNVSLVANVGNDVFGEQAVNGFNEQGINTKFVKKAENAASGIALITVDDKGENTIVVAPGANHTLTNTDILSAGPVIAEADIILLQLEIPLSSVVFAARKAFELGRKVILNPAPACNLPADIYSDLYLITPNETEASLLTGIAVTNEKSAHEAADKLLSYGVQNVIITLGARGAYFKNRERSFLTVADTVEVIDTTAAGDIFNGALAVGLAERYTWEDAIELACKAATISVTRMGAQSSAPLRKEVEQANSTKKPLAGLKACGE